jgi:beta-glucosidase
MKKLLLLLLLLFCIPTSTAQKQELPLYLNPEFPPAKRAKDLLDRMTLDEKIGQMTLIEKNSLDPVDIINLKIGAVLSGGGGYPVPNDAQNWLWMVNRYQDTASAMPTAIPVLYGVDAVHGHNNLRGATIFPHNIGLGATRNPELVEAVGRATALEMKATGIYWNYAPVVAVPQDIRWGRTYEAYSENTEVVTELSTAFLRGLQTEGVFGTPKHFVGDGATTWGTSEYEDYEIDQGVMEVDEETLRRVHLPPYEAAIEAGAMVIMASFSSWQDTKMHGETYLLTDVLKGELGFEGFIVSDWQAIDQLPGDYYSDVVTSINAGIDMNMVPYNAVTFITTLRQAVENGDVSEERIDDAVLRILKVKFMLGLFENPTTEPDPSLFAVVGSEEHRELARQAVRESLVLLQNEGDVLPLAKDTPIIFVAGEAADSIGLQSGGWTIEWQGGMGNITEGTTILEAVEAAVSDETEVYFNRFGRFDRFNDEAGNPIQADIGIVVVGETPYAEGVGDSNDLSLPEQQIGTINRVREVSDRVVVIIFSGRPMVITEQLESAEAWVAAWLPGSEGAGVTDVLFGDAPFTGKLPFTWLRSMEQLPFDFENLPKEGEDAPLFPFGYGLTTE